MTHTGARSIWPTWPFSRAPSSLSSPPCHVGMLRTRAKSAIHSRGAGIGLLATCGRGGGVSIARPTRSARGPQARGRRAGAGALRPRMGRGTSDSRAPHRHRGADSPAGAVGCTVGGRSGIARPPARFDGYGRPMRGANPRQRYQSGSSKSVRMIGQCRGRPPRSQPSTRRSSTRRIRSRSAMPVDACITTSARNAGRYRDRASATAVSSARTER